MTRTKQMEALDVITLALSSLIMLILIHISVFALVRWMYPVQPPAPMVRFAEPAPPPPPPSALPFTEPPHMKQEVNVPTYAPPVSVEAPREAGRVDGGKAPGAAAERPAWLVAVDPKTLE